MTPQELNIERQRDELRKKEAESKAKLQQQMQQQQQQMQQQIQQQQQQHQQQQQQQQQQQIQQQQYINQLQSQIQTQQLNNLHINEPQPANSKPSVTLPPSISLSQLRPNVPDIRAPGQVKDILSRIHNLQPNVKIGNTDTQEETTSNNDRLLSETTLSESNPKKRAGRKPKKAGISIM